MERNQTPMKTKVRSDGYSLWMRPSEENVHMLLREKMAGLAALYGTPTFEPHVTLVEQISIDLRTMARKTKKLADSLQPLRITLGEIGLSGNDDLCKSIYIKAEATDELLNAESIALKAFPEGKTTQAYQPHLTLLYASMPRKEAERLIREHIDRRKGKDHYGAIGFTVGCIDLAHTDREDISAWKVVKSFPLNGIQVPDWDGK